MPARFWIVAYDISEPKRLHAVAATLESAGTRVQKSVFECVLDAAAFADLRERLNQCIDPASDRVRYYPLCPWCVERFAWQGTGEPPEDRTYYIV